MKAAQVVADVLERAGVRRAFCVPGESYLALLNELGARSSIRVVTNRHESGSSFMAEAYAKAGGGVGVCMASRAPGALNLAIGLHTAMQDGTPVVALVGQVPTSVRQRHAFQEVDLAQALAPAVKWAAEVTKPQRLAEFVARALSVAQAARSGPTALVLPEDVLEAELDEAPSRLPPVVVLQGPEPAPESVEQAASWLLQARRPVAVAGRGVLAAGATPLLEQLAERVAMPVYAAWRRLDVFPNEHPCYAGSVGLANHPEVVQALREADLVLAVGTQWNEVTSLGYRLPQGRLIHVEGDPSLLAETPSRVPAQDVLAVVADPGRFLQALVTRLQAAGATGGVVADGRREWVQASHARYLAYSEPQPADDPGFVHPQAVMAQLRRLLPPEAAIVSDAGNFTSWYLRYYRFRLPFTHFAPVSGAMGYGLPAAIGVALADRDSGRWGPKGRPVVVMAGDGGFLMTACELATAVREQVPVVVLVFVNGLYGTVYAHQRRRGATEQALALSSLHNPDFAALARSFGAYGEVVQENGQFEAAFLRALEWKGPAVLELRVRPDRLHALQG